MNEKKFGGLLAVFFSAFCYSTPGVAVTGLAVAAAIKLDTTMPLADIVGMWIIASSATAALIAAAAAAIWTAISWWRSKNRGGGE